MAVSRLLDGQGRFDPLALEARYRFHASSARGIVLRPPVATPNRPLALGGLEGGEHRRPKNRVWST